MDRNTDLIRKLQQFKRAVSKDMPVRQMILFGSQASGRTHPDSDVDLIIVSPAFKTLNFFKRGGRMYDYWDLRLPVDFLCYTPEEFAKSRKQITIVSEAVRNGIAI